jgi:hypothetical protein
MLSHHRHSCVLVFKTCIASKKKNLNRGSDQNSEHHSVVAVFKYSTVSVNMSHIDPLELASISTFERTYPKGVQLREDNVRLLEECSLRREALTFDEVTLEDKPSDGMY